MTFIRSTLYHFVFYVYSAVACLLALPCYFLPRPLFMKIVIKTYLRGNTVLERFILGLRYEIRGLEYLPKTGPYLVASKHQSAYETLKLHLLFPDPAVVLKKELLSIPLWGAFLKKSDVIAIDRSSREEAMQSLEDGALRIKGQGRPIVIYPQGTRVSIAQTPKDKRYKSGIARMQAITELPIIPMALNSGYYYPRSAWNIRSGVVVFQFLPPVPPGLSKEDLMQKLEHEIEAASNALLAEAKSSCEFRVASYEK